MNNKNPIYKKSSILVLIIILSSLLIIGGYIFYKYEEESIRETKYEEIKAIAALKIDQILNWRLERLSEAEFFANSNSIKNLLIEKSNYKKNQEIFEENLFSIKVNHGYRNIALVKDNLEVLHSLENLDDKNDLQTKTDIAKVLKSKKVLITDFKLAANSNSIHIDLISPIIATDSTVNGVMIFCVDPEKFFYPLVQSWPTSSKTSETLLIRDEKDSVLFVTELRHKKNTALELRIPKSAVEVPAVKAVSGYTGIFEGIDYRGEKVLSYITHLPETNWYIVAKVDKNEIYSELYFRTAIIAAFVMILIITISIGLFWIYHYRQRNLYLSLWEAEEEYKTTLYSIGDAVITTDRKGNVKYLNKVAEDLTGWPEKEAKGKDLELVFKIINEETLGKVDNPVKRILMEGLVVGLTNHTILISKDGRELPIADSGAPIKNEKGEIIGVVLVFRDQTEERRSKNEILKLNRIYSLLSNTNQAIVRIRDRNELLYEICRISVEDGKFPLAIIGDIKNDGFEISTIVKMDSENKMSTLIDYEDTSIIHCVKKNYLDTNKYLIINDLEKEVTKCAEIIKERGYKSAGIFAIYVEKKIVAIFCLFSKEKDFFNKEEIILLEEMSADISFSLDYMKSEEKRIESERLNELLNFTIEKSVNEIYLFDAETLKFKYANQGAINNLKYTHQELKELTPLDIKPEYTREEFIRMITPLLKNEKIVDNFRTFHRRADKTEYPVEVNLQLVTRENDRVFLAVVQDITERIKAEEAIKESEDKYRRLAENAQDLIYRYEFLPMRGFTYVSPSSTQMTGYTPEDHYSDPDLGFKLIYPDDRHLLSKMSSAEKIFKEPVVLRWLKKDGTIIWTEQRNIPIYNNNNELIAIEGIARDISARMIAQEEIKRSEEKFRSLFENHSAVKLIIDPETGNIADANRAASDYYGWSINELKKMNMSQINTLPMDALMREMIKVRNQEKTHFEMKHRRADGSIRDVDVYSSKIIIEGKDFLHSIIHDITDKKLTEIRLQLLSKSVEQTPVSIVITNIEGNIEYTNPKFCEVTGYSLEEVLGKNPKILQSGYHTKEFYKEMWEILLSKRDFVCEMRNRKKNGELFWESAVISPIVNNMGEISHFVAIKEDITEKKKILEELIRAKDDAEKSDKLKSEFLAQMSHEIRTPIHIVTSSLGLIKEDMKDKIDEEELELFESIDISAKRIIRTVDLVLNVSELQLGIYKPNFSVIDLDKSILSEVVSEHKQLVKRKKLELFYSYNSASQHINADEYCVIQIFANLIDNAIKYTKTGKVEIDVRDYNKNKLAVEIRDTGIGMSKEFLEHIFEPFHQEYQGYSRAYEGNGLGLALVKKYCELNNAEIEVESEKGIGSIFRVIFKKN